MVHYTILSYAFTGPLNIGNQNSGKEITTILIFFLNKAIDLLPPSWNLV